MELSEFVSINVRHFDAVTDRLELIKLTSGVVDCYSVDKQLIQSVKEGNLCISYILQCVCVCFTRVLCRGYVEVDFMCGRRCTC